MPTNLVICSQNAIDQATLTASPATVSGFPVTNLQLGARSRVMRTNGTGTQEINFTFGGQGYYFNFMALMRHNLEAGATWRVQLFSDPAWTTQIYDSGTVAAFSYLTLDQLDWGFSRLGAGAFTGYESTQFSRVFFNRCMGLSGRITLSNAGNSDGYLLASRLFGGDALEVQWNPEKSGWGWQENTSQTRSPGASLRSDAEEPFRVLQLDLAFTDETQREKLAHLIHDAGLRRDLFVSLWPGQDNAAERDYTFLGKFVGKLPEVGRTGGTNLLRAQFNIQEA